MSDPIERVDFPHEILIRLKPAPEEHAAACYRLERTWVPNTGEVIAEKLLPAEPITVAYAVDVIGQANADLLAQVDAARAETEIERQRANTAEAAIASAETASAAAITEAARVVEELQASTRDIVAQAESRATAAEADAASWRGRAEEAEAALSLQAAPPVEEEK